MERFAAKLKVLDVRVSLLAGDVRLQRLKHFRGNHELGVTRCFSIYYLRVIELQVDYAIENTFH